MKVFGAFFASAVGFFLLTFAPFKTANGLEDLPLTEWVMLSPTLVLLGAGVVVGLVVMVVDLIRERSPHRE